MLDHKWNDLLRKRYRQPIVGIGGIEEVADDSYEFDDIDIVDEAENLRKQIAYLSETYREAIVRHYMNGESVANIAKSMKIPEGTVKSRLHGGRNRIKKGIISMNTYSEQSYRPITLSLLNSGNNGRNHEPQSLIENDLLAQNILWASYEKPLTVEEISKSIGVPAAYVESVIKKLMQGELMRSSGNKYYTDFIIFSIHDKEKYIPHQKEFAKKNFALLWNRKRLKGDKKGALLSKMYQR